MTTKAVRFGIYTRMYRIMRADTRIRELILAGEFSLVYYPVRGQEGVPSSISASLNDDDYITTTYRGMHDSVAKGIPLSEVIAEISGKATGSCKGKGGVMHLSDPRYGVMATSGIVGGAIPIANGLALRAQMTGSRSVAVAYFGDGATNIGAFHEAMNLAAVWKLPVVFVCQNNRYAEFTPREATMCVDRVAERAKAYGVPGVTVDGNDPDALYEVGAAAIERARNGEGPTLIEAVTYRFNGHFFGDTMAYQPKAERDEQMRTNDPVVNFRTRLLADGTLVEDEILAMEAEVDAEVEAAIEFALSSPAPDPADALVDVYAEVIPG